MQDAAVGVDLVCTEYLVNRGVRCSAQQVGSTLRPEEVRQVEVGVVQLNAHALQELSVLLCVEFDHLARHVGVLAQFQHRRVSHRLRALGEILLEHREPGGLDELPRAGRGRVGVASVRVAAAFHADDTVHEVAARRGIARGFVHRPGGLTPQAEDFADLTVVTGLEGCDHAGPSGLVQFGDVLETLHLIGKARNGFLQLVDRVRVGGDRRRPVEGILRLIHRRRQPQ